MSGYEAARAAEHSISYFWPISKTHVYSELARLEGLGWASGSDVRQESVPDKRVFTITPAGERALDAWLVDGPIPDDQHRSPALIKLFFGHRIPRERISKLVAGYRAEADEERKALAEIVAMLDPVPDAAYARATALFGLRICEAIVEWADQVERELPARRVSIDPRRKKATKAKQLFEAAPPPKRRSRR
jgi:DNA-binding PadR family transcriptional regulator